MFEDTAEYEEHQATCAGYEREKDAILLVVLAHHQITTCEHPVTHACGMTVQEAEEKYEALIRNAWSVEEYRAKEERRKLMEQEVNAKAEVMRKQAYSEWLEKERNPTKETKCTRNHDCDNCGHPSCDERKETK